ncbi:hypothetical protein D6783_00545 [Candidatus Woesearchaeota archaeon]|nr:MAG: hypothetical protein D6783_00545 [Candidatus Woesearchaeota archaeon]
MGRNVPFTVAFAIVLVLAGVFLLGRGITGFVVSQSCCFPPFCSGENVCDVAKPAVENGRGGSEEGFVLATLFGVLSVGAATLAVAGRVRRGGRRKKGGREGNI